MFKYVVSLEVSKNILHRNLVIVWFGVEDEDSYGVRGHGTITQRAQL